MLRELTQDEVTFELHVHQEDIPVRGNAICSRDDERDAEVEDDIIVRLNNGDVWAWCYVEVRAAWNGFAESDYLGGCSYAGEDDFRTPGGYFDDMKETALDNLNQVISDCHNRISELETI